jgi:hypothetical protein
MEYKNLQNRRDKNAPNPDAERLEYVWKPNYAVLHLSYLYLPVLSLYQNRPSDSLDRERANAEHDDR